MSGVGPAELLIILVIVGVVFAPTLVAFFVGYLVGQKRSASPSPAGGAPTTPTPHQAEAQAFTPAAPSQAPAQSEVSPGTALGASPGTAPDAVPEVLPAAAPEVPPTRPQTSGDDSENGVLHV